MQRLRLALFALLVAAVCFAPPVRTQAPFLMMGSQGGVPKAVAVDASGNLNIVLNGGSFTITTARTTASQITAGSGTGITVNDAGSFQTATYKVTIAFGAFICNAATCDVTIGTLPAKTLVQHVMADLVTPFVCAATCTTATLSATLGKTAGGAEYLISYDADAAAAQFGKTAAQLGASLTPATTPSLIGDLASWTATTAIVMRMTSAVGNIGTGAATNFNAGSVTYYITTVREQ